MQLSFNSLIIKPLFAILIILCFGKKVYAQATQNLLYNNAFAIPSTTNIGGSTDGRTLFKDNAGNTYIAGAFLGVADFDPSSSVANLVSSGGLDLYFAKYDVSGNYVFAKKIGGALNDIPSSLVVDASGAIYITGYFEGTSDFDPSATTLNLVSNGNREIFIAKYDASGNLIYANSVGGAGQDEGKGIAINAIGEVFITGFYSGGGIDFDPSAATNILPSAGNLDGFIAKYDQLGNCVFAKAILGPNQDAPQTIGLDGTGSIIIAGHFLGTTDFDPSAAVSNLTASSGADCFFAKYDAMGNYIYAKKMGGTSSESVYSMDIDQSNNIYVTGHFSGTCDFDPSAFTVNLVTSSSFSDAFIAKYDLNGNYVYAKKLGGSASSEIGYGIVVDASGSVYVSGIMGGSGDYDPSASSAILTILGYQDVFFGKYDALGNYVWAKSVGTVNYQAYNYAIACDGNGAAYITGNFFGTTDFDPSASVANLVTPGSDAYLGKYDASGNYVMAQQLGTYFSSGSSNVTCMQRDVAGNMYVAGYFTGTVDFDPSASDYFLSSTSYGDMFISKYGPSGNLIFAKSTSGGADEVPESMALDAAGNIYLTGYFSFVVDFDPSASSTYTLYGLNNDVFIAKYDNSGNFVYARSMGGSNQDIGNYIAVDALGSVLVTGKYSGNGDWDPSPTSTVSLFSSGGTDIFIAKYDPSGNYVFAYSLGNSNNDEGRAVVVDAAGNAYFTGFFQGTVDFDPSAAVANLVSGNQHMYIAKYGPTGNYIFAKTTSGFSNEWPASMTMDASGNLYICGNMDGTADFDPSASTATVASNGWGDAFFAKYDQSGNYILAKCFGGVANDLANSIAVDNNNEIYLSGWFDYIADFDPSPTQSASLTSSGNFDIFVAKYDALGNYVLAKGFGGGINQEYGNAITVDPTGSEVAVSGLFKGVVDFDPNASVAILSSSGYDIGFYAKYGLCTSPPVATNLTPSSNQTICANSSATLMASGTATVNWYSSLTSTNVLSSSTAFVTSTLSVGNYSFYAENKDACGPAPFRTLITVTVTATPVVSVNSGSICSTSIFTMNPSGAVTYTFSSTSSTVSPLSNSSYTVIGAAANGCTNSAISNVSVQPLPIITVNSGSICVGNSFSISPSGATTYTYFASGPIVSPSVNTSYSVTGTSSVGCLSSNTAIASVTVSSLPLPVISVNDATICSGESFTIIPSGALTYTFFNAGPIVSPSVNTNFSVVGTDANGCVSSNTAISIVSVNFTPTVVVNSGGICIGNSFTINPSGASTYSFASTGPIVTPVITTVYTITGTALNGCTNIAFSTVTVNPLPTVSINPGGVCINSSYTLNPTGASTYTYFNSGPIVSPTVATTYSIIGSSSAGCISSNTAVISLSVFPQPTITVSDGTICIGQTFTLMPTGANTYTYSSGNPTVSPLATTTYSMIGTGANGCLSANLAVATVTVYQQPTITVNSGSICSGESFTMVPNGASTYTFSSTAAVVSPSVNSSYTVTATSAFGCSASNLAISNVTVQPTPTIVVNSGSVCSGNSFVIVPSGASTYTFLNSTATVTPSSNATYSVIGTNSLGCVSTNTAVSNVTVYAVPNISVSSSSTLICVGQTATLSVSGANSYTWDGGSNASTVTVTPSVTSTFTLIASDVNNCMNTAVFTQSVDVCAGTSNVFHVQNESVYPNPNFGEFTLETFEECDMVITNCLDQVVYKERILNKRTMINVSDLSPGLYFVRIIHANNVTTYKVIKN